MSLPLRQAYASNSVRQTYASSVGRKVDRCPVYLFKRRDIAPLDIAALISKEVENRRRTRRRKMRGRVRGRIILGMRRAREGYCIRLEECRESGSRRMSGAGLAAFFLFACFVLPFLLRLRRRLKPVRPPAHALARRFFST